MCVVTIAHHNKINMSSLLVCSYASVYHYSISAPLAKKGSRFLKTIPSKALLFTSIMPVVQRQLVYLLNYNLWDLPSQSDCKGAEIHCTTR